MADKRRATWIADEELRQDMRDCCKSDSALFAVIGTNSKIGAKILSGDPIKKDKLKDAINKFLELMAEVRAGTAEIDNSKYHTKDLKNISEKYNGGTWKEYSENLDGEED